MSAIAQAASVLLFRETDPAELFVVRRADALRFFGGFYAFPGGRICPTDREIPVEQDGPEQIPAKRVVAAARELFEETGVLVARRRDRSFPSSASVLRYLRRKMAAENLPFRQVLLRLGLSVHAADFLSLGSAITPSFLPHRFDTAFFMARLPPAQECEVWPGELVSGEWASADTVLARWTRGEWLVSPPTVLILEAIRHRAIDDLRTGLTPVFERHATDEIPPIYLAPEVQLIPLDTQSLPPSTHTNAYLLGRDPAYLLDPGSATPHEQQRLFTAINARRLTGSRLRAVVLTHHHPDHIGAATATADRYGVPILSHPLTAAKLEGKVPVSGTLADGDRLELGCAPDGTGAWHLEAIHTPGHAPGHLAFYDPHYRLLFAGDMVSTLSSVVIAPPEGDLDVYLHSLRRLRSYDARLLLPAHGSPSARPRHVLDECLAHRARRERELLRSLGREPRGVGDLTVELYKGLQPALVRFAELQVTAGLIKLAREGRAESRPEGWLKL